MRIEQSISELLYRYQCVTIPNFGAFLTETIPAQYNSALNTFSPPRKLLSFNLHIKNNDGLLANHLAQKEQVTYDVALRFIAIVVEEWMHVLKQNRKLEFEKIGKIELSSENNLVFTPSNETNFYLHSFGLTSVVSQNVLRIVKTAPDFVKIENADSVSEVSYNDDEVNEVKTELPRKSLSWVRYAASFIVFASVSAAVGGYFHKQYVDNETKLIASKVQNQVNQKIQEATFFIENPLPAITVTLAQSKSNYHIVGGAFKTYENAEKFAGFLLNSGFNAKVGEINKYGLYPVFYESFKTNEEALEKLDSIKNNYNKDAWILFSEE
jgi:nucleoid DNA-binding protein